MSLKITIETISFGIDTAIPCGLIVNELVTNSLKYAFPEGKDGEIRISLRKNAETFELKVSDNGIGIPQDLDYRNTESLGLRLITNLSENQLQGTVKLIQGEGTGFLITFKEIQVRERT